MAIGRSLQEMSAGEMAEFLKQVASHFASEMAIRAA